MNESHRPQVSCPLWAHCFLPIYIMPQLEQASRLSCLQKIRLINLNSYKNYISLNQIVGSCCVQFLVDSWLIGQFTAFLGAQEPDPKHLFAASDCSVTLEN